MTDHIIQALAVLAMGVYGSAVLTVMGALSLITLTSFGAISAPY